jgi:hypothetical protein
MCYPSHYPSRQHHQTEQTPLCEDSVNCDVIPHRPMHDLNIESFTPFFSNPKSFQFTYCQQQLMEEQGIVRLHQLLGEAKLLQQRLVQTIFVFWWEYVILCGIASCSLVTCPSYIVELPTIHYPVALSVGWNGDSTSRNGVMCIIPFYTFAV